MNFTYQTTTDVSLDEDNESVSVYGIEAVDRKGHVLRCIPNIFTNRDLAEKFVSLCNAEALELIHLDDVIEDMLS